MKNPLKAWNLPPSPEVHLWADAVELRCLANPDRIISKADISAEDHKSKEMRAGMADVSDLRDEGQSQTPKDIRQSASLETLYQFLEHRV